MCIRIFAAAVAVASLVAAPDSAEAGPLTPQQAASINVAAAYSRDTLRMTTFQAEYVRQDGTLVNATCTRTVTYRGVTTTTRYAVSFSIGATVPPRGGSVGQLYVSGVTSNIIP